MPRYYFTYGTSNTQPFRGGWTEVIAPNMKVACEIFRLTHPDMTPGILNCADYYSEDDFCKTGLSGPSGNLGAHCHEIISLSVRRVVTLVSRDSHSRPVYTDASGKLYVDTDPRKGSRPCVRTKLNNAFDGEPDVQVHGEFEFLPVRDTWD